MSYYMNFHKLEKRDKVSVSLYIKGGSEQTNSACDIMFYVGTIEQKGSKIKTERVRLWERMIKS